MNTRSNVPHDVICGSLKLVVECISVEEVLELPTHHGGPGAAPVDLEALQQRLPCCLRLGVLAQETQTPVETHNSDAWGESVQHTDKSRGWGGWGGGGG